MKLYQIEIEGETAGVATLDRQVTFAAAVALTKTAASAREASVRAILSTFTTRSQWYAESSPFGVRFRGASKGNLSAEVRAGAGWLRLHETGGTKTPRGRFVAVPTRFARPSPGAIIPAERRPAALADAVVIRTRSGALVLAERTAEGLRPLYLLTPRARIRRQSTIFDPTSATFEKEFPVNFSRALSGAIKTAKP